MKKDKGKKVLQATSSDHEASDEEFDMSEFCFMGIEEEELNDFMEEED